MTLVVSNPSGSIEPGLSVTLLPPAVTIRGPETNQLCANSVDDDGDGSVNDGCPAVGISAESGAQCNNSVDDDGDTAVNDGCPSVGAPPVGAVAGKAYVSENFALLNNPCNSAIASSGYPYLMNATVDNSLPMEYGSLPPGSQGDEGPLEFFRDDGNGNGVPRHADRYPSFLNQILDPDRVGDINGDGDEFDTVGGVPENPGASSLDWYGMVEPVRPVARYTMSWFVTTQAQLLQILVFSPGALAAFQPPHPLSEFRDPALGYAVIAVIGDPTLPPGPAPVTDACSPSQVVVMLWGKTRDNPCTGGSCPNDDTPCYFGCGNNGPINSLPGLVDSGSGSCSGTNEAGCVRYANPSTAGTYRFSVYQQSQRDADNDGKENTLDTCPLNADTLDPRTGAGPDTDGDRIANACDTIQTGGDDQDGDGFLNTQDNCPRVANPDQLESESTTPWAQAAPRGGSRADAIGDACDNNDTKADGHFHTVLTVVPKCIGATDSDLDGWCNTDETAYGSHPSYATRTPEHYDLFVPLALTHSGSGNTPTVPTAETACGSNSVDDDGDTFVNDGCPVVGNTPETGSQCTNAIDNDGDGVVNDGCPASGAAESGTQCTDSSDDDGDTLVNDGCPTVSGEWGSQCWGNADNDGDGARNDGCPAQTEREPRQLCNDGIDNDVDGLVDALDAGCAPVSVQTHIGYPACPQNGCLGIDTDGDGFTDEAEIDIGTGALGRCGVGGALADPPSTAWPLDFKHAGVFGSTDKILIDDFNSFLSPRRLDTSPGDALYDVRWDLDPGPGAVGPGWINVGDVNKMLGGATAFPPMFGGERALGGPACTAHPMYGD
jgi:hypothetical protein